MWEESGESRKRRVWTIEGTGMKTLSGARRKKAVSGCGGEFTDAN